MYSLTQSGSLWLSNFLFQIFFFFFFHTERDSNKEVLWVWSYPTIDGEVRELLMRKCTLDQEEESQLEFSFGHFLQTWYYLCNFQTAESHTLPKVDVSTNYQVSSSVKVSRLNMLMGT